MKYTVWTIIGVRFFLVIGGLLTFAAAPCVADELRAQRDGVVKNVNIQTPDFQIETVAPAHWQVEIEQIGAKYLRLRITQSEWGGDEEVTLELRDRNGRRVRQYTADDLQARRTFWTVAIPGDYVLVSLGPPSLQDGFKLTIDRIAYQAYAGAPLSTWGDDEKEHIANYASNPVVSAVQRPVARLLFMEDGVPKTCTGFLLESGLLMTNHHCVSTQVMCDTAVAVFGYQHDANGRLDFGDQFECAQVLPDKLSFELDYAIIDLRGNPEDKWGALAITPQDPKPDDVLFIVQHPGGEPKQISRINCAARAVPVDGRGNETDFTHTCDTVGGSSGSPVFDEDGNVVGLHHYGFGTSGRWTENRAVRMSRIVEHLQR